MSFNVEKYLCSEWKDLLSEEFEKPYFKALNVFLDSEISNNTVFPPQAQIFRAFELCKPNNVKAVIMGQDPYHGQGEADGLAFSVNRKVKIPPSLRNIYKELHNDTGAAIPDHGELEAWAEQGVLLLNAVLTVRKDSAASHRNKGWEMFTDRVISILSSKYNNLVFILWGNFAISKKELIDAGRHQILTAVHPSPLSASRGFFGCKHFSAVNSYLADHGKKPVKWEIGAVNSMKSLFI